MGNIWAGLYNTKNHLTTVADVAIATRTSANIISFFTTLNIITPASPGWALFCLALASCLYCPPIGFKIYPSRFTNLTKMSWSHRKTQNRDTFYEQSAGSSVWFGSYSAATAGSSVFAFVLVEWTISRPKLQHNMTQIYGWNCPGWIFLPAWCHFFKTLMAVLSKNLIITVGGWMHCHWC